VVLVATGKVVLVTTETAKAKRKRREASDERATEKKH
jgi:hypothetical protein